MAYVEEQDPKKLLVPGAPSTTNQGSTLAGSGGMASPGAASPTAASTPGTGFTNLESYLGANKGQGAKVAGEINVAGDASIKEAKDTATGLATGYETAGTTAANAGAAQGIADAQSGKSGTTAYSGPAEAPKDNGPNGLEEAYTNVNNKVDAFSANPYGGQSALQKNHGYGSGFAALDNFIGRQDGRPEIQKWEKDSKAGNAQSSYDKGNAAIASAKGNLKTAQDGWKASQEQHKAENPNTPPTTTNNGTGPVLPPTALPIEQVTSQVHTDEINASIPPVGEIVLEDRTPDVQTTVDNADGDVSRDTNGEIIRDADGMPVRTHIETSQTPATGDDGNIQTTATTAPGMTIPTGTALPTMAELNAGVGVTPPAAPLALQGWQDLGNLATRGGGLTDDLSNIKVDGPIGFGGSDVGNFTGGMADDFNAFFASMSPEERTAFFASVGL